MSDAPQGRRSLADTIFDQLQRSIKSGAYAEEERLPTEHDLATEFAVSRPIVREALRRLREQGLIYSRRGAGSFVRSVGLRNPLGFGQLENVSDLLNCYEFRITIEPQATALAAERYDDDAMADIEQALHAMRDATNRRAHREDADFQFHLAITRAAQNLYFFTAIEALKDHIAVGMRFHGASVKREESGLEQVYAEHAAICQAIKNRDTELAARLMRDHLIGSRDRLFEKRRL